MTCLSTAPGSLILTPPILRYLHVIYVMWNRHLWEGKKTRYLLYKADTIVWDIERELAKIMFHFFVLLVTIVRFALSV